MTTLPGSTFGLKMTESSNGPVKGGGRSFRLIRLIFGTRLARDTQNHWPEFDVCRPEGLGPVLAQRSQTLGLSHWSHAAAHRRDRPARTGLAPTGALATFQTGGQMPSTKNRAPGANARPCPEGRSTECRRDSPAAVAGRQQILHFDLSQTAEISTFRPRLSLPISARLRNFHYSFGTHHRPGGVQGYRVGAPSSARSRRRHDVATAGKVQIMPSKASGPRRTASSISPTSDEMRVRHRTHGLRAHVGSWSAKGVQIGPDLCPWRQLEVRKSTPHRAKPTLGGDCRRDGLGGIPAVRERCAD